MINKSNTARLYIVATPIGNLQDISQRAVQTLKNVDFIAAEDTRTSGVLLKHFAISTPCIAYHQHNEKKASQMLLDKLLAGQDIALISDAGTPLISDPGYVLVSLAQKKGIQVVPIPGASAIMAALSASGLPTDRFLFVGFLPAKTQGREKVLKALQGFDASMVFYESCHRIEKTIASMIKVFGEQRQVCFARELTKQFETIKLTTLLELQSFMAADDFQKKGEIVLIVAGHEQQNTIDYSELDRLLLLLLKNMSASHAAKVASQYFELAKKTCYQRALQLENE